MTPAHMAPGGAAPCGGHGAALGAQGTDPGQGGAEAARTQLTRAGTGGCTKDGGTDTGWRGRQAGRRGPRHPQSPCSGCWGRTPGVLGGPFPWRQQHPGARSRRQAPTCPAAPTAPGSPDPGRVRGARGSPAASPPAASQGKAGAKTPPGLGDPVTTFGDSQPEPWSGLVGRICASRNPRSPAKPWTGP